ncbi:MAG: N-acetylmuramoyl-L-alanine amidase [Clostridiales bacterium]|nr:N-acetylmuramoyl-L-alanine amidase [Clostridiales bacterium]
MSSEILKKSNRKGNSSVLKLILTVLLFVIIVLFAIIFGTRGSRETKTTTDASVSTIETTEQSTSYKSPETTTATSIETTTETTQTDSTSEETTETTATDSLTTTETETDETTETTTINPIVDKIEVQLLVINKYSRPGTKLTSVDWIIVHYVANPGTTAQQNRNYFNGLATSHKTSASAHFVIGLNGEIIQCIPLDEVSYNAGSTDYNRTSISIECCHPDASGQFNEATYQSLVQLVSFLREQYGLSREHVIRHYDVTGKDCPKYWAGKEGTEQYARWKSFLDDVDKHLK